MWIKTGVNTPGEGVVVIVKDCHNDDHVGYWNGECYIATLGYEIEDVIAWCQPEELKHDVNGNYYD